MTTRHLSIAVRAYTVRAKSARRKHSEPRAAALGWPRDVLIFDTETTTDTAQRLTFGSYRYCRWREKGDRLVCREEGFFYADELPDTDPEGFFDAHEI